MVCYLSEVRESTGGTERSLLQVDLLWANRKPAGLPVFALQGLVQPL